MGACGPAGPEMGVDSHGVHFFRSGSYVLKDINFVASPLSRADRRIEGMDNAGIDYQVVSPNPMTYFYSQPQDIGLAFNRKHNDLMAALIAGSNRLFGCAALPMQDPEASCHELHRAINELGLLASYIGSDIAGVPLSDPRFEELWAEHERLGVPVVVHPAPRNVEGGIDPFFQRWDLDILFGFLIDESLAVAHLLLAGVLDRHPDLHVHVPHGGGFVPYQKGRLELGQARRSWGPRLLERSFVEQWAQLSFDSAVHSLDALRFLVATEGCDRVLLGTNFAGWDYDESMTSAIEALDVSDEDKQAILGRNATRIFGIPSS